MRLRKLFSAVPLLFLLLLAGACNEKKTLFALLPADHTGIRFANTIRESDTLNILTEEYIYNGGGVGVGDFNNDGLTDLYFTGNMVPNKLYLNEGDLTFKDVTEQARVTGNGNWCSGVAVVDLNGDGWQDLYVGATLRKDSLQRTNLLYLNNGPGADGIPTFTEAAGKYGIADRGNTTHSAFLDYDRDGDLDLYVLTNLINNQIPSNYRPKITDGTAINNDRLYRNNGNGTFTNVTRAAGIRFEGYGLGVAVSDINLDGWPDLYITNDYLSNDLLYINNGNGTFSNRIEDYVKHTCHSAMGNDVVDVNNDGLVDIIALDMLPEYNKRKKTMLGANNYVTYINNEKYGYQHQYVRNVLQLNQGFTPAGHPVFSEIGQLAGVYQTDWSWTPLVADFDNDGQRDILVTNGFPRDVTDHDFTMYRASVGNVAGPGMLVDSIPIVKTSNYAFRSKGDLTYEDVTEAWGMKIPSFSNGAAYADLDNDGDLDVVVNNINDEAFVYENQLYRGSKKAGEGKHYLRVKLDGGRGGSSALGAKVRVWQGGRQQYYEHTLYRGYLSTVEPAAHFGLGAATRVDSLEVFWPDGTYQRLNNLSADQTLTLRARDAAPTPGNLSAKLRPAAGTPLYEDASDRYGVAFRHEEEDRVDFYVQRTIPHKFSEEGPGLAVGDADGDGLDDFYVGGAANRPGTLFIQRADGTFRATAGPGGAKKSEDMGALFFDADGDGDQDLYAVSGSNEWEAGSDAYQDRLYRNDGKGKFTLDAAALPPMRSPGSCVKAADFDRDGDLDLFRGGRGVPNRYPLPGRSFLLRNEGGKFTDATDAVYPGLKDLGMVTDALWSDFDGDRQADLVVVGEWMPVTFLRNGGGVLKNATAATGLAGQVGWWNSLAAGDFDRDGDLDYVAGNLGLNTNYKANANQPLAVYGGDFDDNGNFDAVLSCYMKAEDGQMKPFPLHTRDDLIVQLIRTRRDYPTYVTYGQATTDQLISAEDRRKGVAYQASQFASSYLQNLGNGKFALTPLPAPVQFAPVKGMLPTDADGDGHLDLLLVGNDYATEVFTGRYDALVGQVLRGDGKGGFAAVPLARSGFFVDGDARGVAQLADARGNLLTVVTQNRDSVRVFRATPAPGAGTSAIVLEPGDAWVEIGYADGRKQTLEAHYGGTYLSQSTRTLSVPAGARTVTVINYAGERRPVVPKTESAGKMAAAGK
ncbi:MAG: FIG01019539: hypothetical protein [uncultured Cytophagales bacterium]|uniref:ASPIC/UnbV domain-containing protein n=1 Tax=uncultured Cytophagales bacterium TaxID=158755 RepID=A0A6J4KVR0_9SPHI|nr:MAG: FIG01019539: hypothetical protein [uncultured Cytophagales bacterium]